MKALQCPASAKASTCKLLKINGCRCPRLGCKAHYPAAGLLCIYRGSREGHCVHRRSQNRLVNYLKILLQERARFYEGLRARAAQVTLEPYIRTEHWNRSTREWGTASMPEKLRLPQSGKPQAAAEAHCSRPKTKVRRPVLHQVLCTTTSAP